MRSAVLAVSLALSSHQAPDTATALRQAQDLILEHYDNLEITGRFNLRSVGTNLRACRAISLQDCMEGDWSCLDSGCDWGHAEQRAELIPKLENLAPVAGNSEWLFRQRVGFAIKNDEPERADAIALSCGDGQWWCQTLRGLTAHLLHPGDGLAHFDSAFALAADDPSRMSSGRFARCQWSDIRAVVPVAMLDEVRGLRCPEGEGLSTRFWWLADPLWTREGNERYGEHFARLVMIRMNLDVQELLQAAALEGRYEKWLWESHATYDHVLREGFPNSNTEPCWDNPNAPIRSRARYACLRGARQVYVHGGYSFGPDEGRLRRPLGSTAEDWAVEWHNGGCQPPWNRGGCGRKPMPRVPRPADPGNLVGHDGCHRPWKLEECGAERMITRERWHNLSHQTVVFRRGAQLLVVSAARVPEELGPAEELEAALALGGVANLDLQVVPVTLDAERVVRVRSLTDAADYLASIEVVGPDEIGRARFGAPGPSLSEGFGVSVPALVHPLFESGSLALEEALYPSTELSAESYLGLYFEIYGLEEGEAVEFSLSFEKTDLSFFERIAGALRIAGAEEAWALTWEDPSGEVSKITGRFFSFDLANLDKAEYRLILEVRAGDGKKAEVSRQITLR